jgi:hypothetical protein
MVHHIPFFCSIGDSVSLGIAKGMYSALSGESFKKMVNAELDKQLGQSKSAHNVSK